MSSYLDLDAASSYRYYSFVCLHASSIGAASYRLCAYTFHSLIMSHMNVSLFLVCVYKVQVLPHHQNFSGYVPVVLQVDKFIQQLEVRVIITLIRKKNSPYNQLLDLVLVWC